MTISIRRALIVAFSAIVLGITVALLGLTMAQRDRLVRDLAPRLLDSAQSRADSQLEALFGDIRRKLAVHARQVGSGLLRPHDAASVRDLLLPEAQHVRSVGSMMVGDTTGYQLLLMRYDSLVTGSPLLAGRSDLPAPSHAPARYITREFRAAERGERSVWTLWDSAGARATARWEVPLPGYDPRRREWLLRAVARRAEWEAAGREPEPESLVAWTDVYTLFTSKTPGISAAVSARTGSGDLVVVAYDLLLDDLGEYARALSPTASGRVFVIGDSGQVVGAPRLDPAAGPEAYRRATLRPLDEIGGPELAAWMEHWRARDSRAPGPFRFRAAGAHYWGSFHAHPLDSRTSLWIGVSVPEADLLASSRHDPAIIMALAVLALLLALAIAVAISRHISRPLEAILDRSRRIAALELDPAQTPPSMLTEVRELGVSIEKMREDLRDHLSALERARAALIESEQRFRATFEQAAVGMCHVSTEGRFLRVNDRLCEILGHTREELMKLRIEDVTHPDHKQTDRDRIGSLVKGERDTDSWEKRYIQRSGAVIWGQVTTRLLRDAHGRPKHFISVVQDINARIALEGQLRQSQKLEAVGQLAGGVAHDFNNLLTVVSGHATLAKRGLADGSPQLADIEQIEHAAQRASDLTRQLLAFARREILEAQVLDPARLIEDNRRMLSRLLNEDIVLDSEVPSGTACVRIDRAQLEQVLVNLVVNARDAMPGGGRIDLRVCDLVLPMPEADPYPAMPAGRYVEFAVSDSGIGMDAEVLARIFEPFFTTKPMGRGTGLGLSTCYGIVQQAGGSIVVESRPGEGSMFRFILPAVDRESASEAGSEAAKPLARGSETILFAEDEPSIRMLGERSLRERGYIVHSAADGAEALAIGENLCEPIDLLVTDVIMPGMRGRELADRLRSKRPGIRVLFVSGYGQDSLQGPVPEGTQFLAKPYGPEALARKVRSALDADA